jgi:hypothetical protein
MSYTNADPDPQPNLLFPRDKKEVFTFLNGDEKTTTFGEVFTRSGRLVRGPLIVRPPQLEQAVYLDYEDELGMSDYACFFLVFSVLLSEIDARDTFQPVLRIRDILMRICTSNSWIRLLSSVT